MADVQEQTIERGDKRKLALKYAEDGRLATLAVMGDDRATLNREERIKLEKHPFEVWKDVLERYAEGGFDSIDEDDMVRFKWIGVYQQRPKTGHFMMRLKVPGGVMNTAQLRETARLTRKHARGIADITTRQDFQMHWLTIEVLPEVVGGLAGVGLTTLGACGDIARNICGSPIDGVDPNEMFSTLPLINEATAFFNGNRDYADLPRKHKMLIVGNRTMGQSEIHEIALYGVKRADDGAEGFHVIVGGGLSTEPHVGQNLGVFVTRDEALLVIEKITAIYRDHGYRKNRKHARLKYLVADWGAVEFRARLEEYLGYALRDAEPNEREWPSYEDQLGVYPQKQEGLSFIGVPVVSGRMTSDQIDEVANIAEEFGTGEVRLTVMQNLYLINIPNDKTEEVCTRLAAVGLPVEASAIRRGVVACTGIEFCNLAVTETKERAKTLVNLLDQSVNWRESQHFRINVNGCPNSCGQHWIADVGLQGCTKKIDGVLVEHYDMFLGGTLGSNAAFNRRIKRVSAEEVAPTVTRLITHFQSNRQGEESFSDFCRRHNEEELEAML